MYRSQIVNFPKYKPNSNPLLQESSIHQKTLLSKQKHIFSTAITLITFTPQQLPFHSQRILLKQPA